MIETGIMNFVLDWLGALLTGKAGWLSYVGVAGYILIQLNGKTQQLLVELKDEFVEWWKVLWTKKTWGGIFVAAYRGMKDGNWDREERREVSANIADLVLISPLMMCFEMLVILIPAKAMLYLMRIGGERLGLIEPKSAS